MKANKIPVLIVALGAIAFAVHAQDGGNDAPPGGPGGGQGSDSGPGPGQGEHHHHRPPMLPLVKALDVNHDGVIDSNEIANASAELLTLDKNGDGKLTVDEYMPPRPADMPQDDSHRPPMPLIVKALDVNGDGVIDATEIANAPAELKTLDKKGDGRLTRDEYIGKRPQRPPQDGGGPGGPNGDPNGGPDGGAGGPPPGGPDGASDGPPQ